MPSAAPTVSPGGQTQSAVAEARCPTFSWSGAEAAAGWSRAAQRSFQIAERTQALLGLVVEPGPDSTLEVLVEHLEALANIAERGLQVV